MKGVEDEACAPVSRVNFESDILRTNGTNTGVLSLICLMCGMYLVTQAQNVKKSPPYECMITLLHMTEEETLN